ncbi:MAG: fasciclin domain-containing protein [Rubrivivax sp.]|nr:fasciclin domain-containing protein [Rubrivivax sp.]
MLKWIRLSMAALATSFVAACGGGDNPAFAIADVTATDSRFGTLNQALVNTGLQATLLQSGTFTVFAPTDDAFNALATELGITRAQLLADRALLTSVLQYHVLGSTVPRASVPLGRAITPLAGGIFKVDSVGGNLVITDGRNRTSRITATDIGATNGVIHVVDRVLLPPNRNIVQTAQSLPQFSILVEAVVAANLQGALSGTGPLTVFAPTNDAFVALLGELGLTKAQLLANTALLTRVLTYHVLPNRTLKADITTGQAITTLQGGTFTIGNDLAITDSRARRAGIAGTDVLTSNGVIHVIDRVILPLPAETIVQTAQSLPQFSILVEAVVAANLQGALSGTGPLTVFAPTNDAFVALLGELGLTKAQLLANVPLLTKVLTYHVVPGRVLRAQVPVGPAITTLQGETFTVDSTLAITDRRGRRASITATDVFTSNGVIHVLDRVILPAP